MTREGLSPDKFKTALPAGDAAASATSGLEAAALAAAPAAFTSALVFFANTSEADLSLRPNCSSFSLTSLTFFKVVTMVALTFFALSAAGRLDIVNGPELAALLDISYTTNAEKNELRPIPIFLLKMKLLFIYIETDGLPKYKYAPYTEPDLWCKITKMDWLLVDCLNDWLILSEGSGGSRGSGNNEEPETSLKLLGVDLTACDAVIAHNIQFTKTAVLAACQRLFIAGNDYYDPLHFWGSKKEICTMTTTKRFCGLTFKDSTDLKFPKLSELYFKLFGETFEEPVQVIYLATCFQSLTDAGVI